eukprot:SM000079S22492  [mRNA]  locus=s79:532339:536090:+ [translate_table: standard]
MRGWGGGGGGRLPKRGSFGLLRLDPGSSKFRWRLSQLITAAMFLGAMAMLLCIGPGASPEEDEKLEIHPVMGGRGRRMVAMDAHSNVDVMRHLQEEHTLDSEGANLESVETADKSWQAARLDGMLQQRPQASLPRGDAKPRKVLEAAAHQVPKSSGAEVAELLIGQASPEQVLLGTAVEEPAEVVEDGLSPLQRAANDAWAAGKKTWNEVQAADLNDMTEQTSKVALPKCLQAITKRGTEIRESGFMVVLPCGMTVGSSITIVGRPRAPELNAASSSFHVELQGLRVVDGEDPPRILHVNPRLMGDWSGRPVIEQNTCYRSQWGIAQRCEGWQSRDEEEKVEGYRRCEKWSQQEDTMKDNEKTSGWLQRLIYRTNKEALEWPFPFEHKRVFVMTLRAGFEGFHVTVDGHHISSFPYRTGFIVEEATGVHFGGDLDIQSFVATTLPLAPPARHAVLEQSDKLKSPPLRDGPVEMFIGILSSSNHFAERAAVRKTWMQHPLIRNGDVVARFFLAMHPSKQVNLEVRKESELYGDLVIVPFIDRYDLVVLKTIEICKYGVKNVSAKYVMKVDDDTFVRVDTVLAEVKGTYLEDGLYMGNINEFHKPLREGKWAVTEEEWPEATYPPYANGPGYIITRDIALFIARMSRGNNLRIFKMEDVSMGMWVGQFGQHTNETLHYVHNWRFCQFGCIEDYFTAHYQSPRQMICMWGKLAHGEPRCCNQ